MVFCVLFGGVWCSIFVRRMGPSMFLSSHVLESLLSLINLLNYWAFLTKPNQKLSTQSNYIMGFFDNNLGYLNWV